MMIVSIEKKIEYKMKCKKKNWNEILFFKLKVTLIEWISQENAITHIYHFIYH